MKNLLYIFLFVSFLSSCREEPPLIDFHVYAGAVDSVYLLSSVPSAQPKNSLLEDYTGVRCANCPEAHDAAKNLALSHPGRMDIISMHPVSGGSLTKPYNMIKDFEDFRLDEASALFDNFGLDKNLPSIGLDRINNTLRNKYLTNGVGDWSSILDIQLQKSTPLNIVIENSMQGNDSIKINCYVYSTTSVQDDSVFLTLVMLEDGVINPQEQNTGNVDTFYVHNNLARAFLTPPYGSWLKTSFKQPGSGYRKQLIIPINQHWNLNNCKVLAFVHKSISIKGEIWHSATQKVK